MISEPESEGGSESKEEDDITCNNEYLDQDLEELGPDRLDREDTDESDAENEVSEEFKRSKYFSQLVINLEGKLGFRLPSEVITTSRTFGM